MYLSRTVRFILAVLALVLVAAVILGAHASSIKEAPQVVATTVRIVETPRQLNAGAILERLIATHPHQQVRDEFYKLIRDGKILISYGWSSTSAAFLLVRVQDLDLPRSVIPGATRIPVLDVNPDMLQAASQNHAMWVRAQLVVFHEFVHFVQWQTGSKPADTFFPELVDQADSSFYDACMKKWYAEKEAYHQECAFARRTNLLDRLDPRASVATICRTSDEDFDRVLRDTMPPGDPAAKMCADVWATF